MNNASPILDAAGFCFGGIILNWNVLQVLETAVDAAALRQRVIAHNIANLNTPGFKASRVSFEEELRAWLKGDSGQLSVTSAGHIGRGNTLPTPGITKSGASKMRPDGNNVDLDSEQVILAANLIKYQALSRQIDDQFAQMRYVISDGRR